MRRRFIGNDQTRASAVQAVEATGMQMAPRKSVHPGNFSGLDNSKSAFLQHNQGGYLNPNIHRARNSLKSLRQTIPDVPSGTFLPSIAGKMLDKRTIRREGSALAKLMKTIK